jgi:hypothetical protein
MANRTQIIWGATRIIDIEHTPYYKILRALQVVYKALRNEYKFGHALVKQADMSKYGGFGLDETTYKLYLSNYNKLHKALILLSRQEYITRYVLRSCGTLVVYWYTGHINLSVFKHVERLHENHDLSMFEEPQKRSKEQAQLEHRSDETAVRKPWCDGKPLPVTRQRAVTSEEYNEHIKLSNKLHKLPKNYVEGLPK